MPASIAEHGPAALAAIAALAALGWARNSVSTKHGLALATELGTLFAPSQGAHNSLRAFASMLRRRYGADACLLITDVARGRDPVLFLADGERAVPARGEPLDPRLAIALLAVPTDCVALYRASLLPGGAPVCRTHAGGDLSARPGDPAALQALAVLLEASALLSVPLRSRERTLGRVHLVLRHGRYRWRHLLSLAGLMELAAPWIGNLHLVERLSAKALTKERRRISRDLHDSTVQPYIGLKLGLEALRRRLEGSGAVAREVDELIRMAGDGITELRRYVGSLKAHEGRGANESILEGVREQARKFSEFYGVRTEVRCEGEVAVPPGLCDEITQMVREALSNVRRHTDAARAEVSLRLEGGELVLEVANERAATAAAPRFLPRSIDERARELGGNVRVGQRENGDTSVSVRLPL
jgi:signal transduction histidine kinase